ncbi:MAG: tetratricopeptide repeat protein [Thermosynechococcaceae cyanobacterium]
MIEAIESAISSGNYSEAAQLVQQLDPQDPWTLLYLGKVHEAQQQWDDAEAAYRDLLRQSQGPKLTLAARQGLQRLQDQRTQDRKASIAQAIASPEKAELGVLVLEAVAMEAKKEAAQHMAQIMNIDAYAARMLLPSKGVRLYRSGPIGELEFYGQQLNNQGIPAFWIPLSALRRVTVYPVCYFESFENLAGVVAQSNSSEQDTLSLKFSWTDVTRRVEGQLPIFEEVVERDRRGKLLRKEQTQDHAQFCDLHLPKQNCILRFSDAGYQFHRGASLDTIESSQSSLSQNTAWANWRLIKQIFDQKLPKTVVDNDFNSFAETAMDHPDLLDKIPAHINLFRRAETNWDPAFQLYSSLLFLHQD